MRHLIISTLSAIALSSIVAPAFANEVVSPRKINQISPFSLITSGFQGRLKPHGIPGGTIFLSKIRSNRIGAKDLVQSAISSGRLSEDTLNDTEYLSQVDSLLNSLDRI